MVTLSFSAAAPAYRLATFALLLAASGRVASGSLPDKRGEISATTLTKAQAAASEAASAKLAAIVSDAPLSLLLTGVTRQNLHSGVSHSQHQQNGFKFTNFLNKTVAVMHHRQTREKVASKREASSVKRKSSGRKPRAAFASNNAAFVGGAAPFTMTGELPGFMMMPIAAVAPIDKSEPLFKRLWNRFLKKLDSILPSTSDDDKASSVGLARRRSATEHQLKQVSGASDYVPSLHLHQHTHTYGHQVPNTAPEGYYYQEYPAVAAYSDYDYEHNPSYGRRLLQRLKRKVRLCGELLKRLFRIRSKLLKAPIQIASINLGALTGAATGAQAGLLNYKEQMRRIEAMEQVLAQAGVEESRPEPYGPLDDPQLASFPAGAYVDRYGRPVYGHAQSHSPGQYLVFVNGAPRHFSYPANMLFNSNQMPGPFPNYFTIQNQDLVPELTPSGRPYITPLMPNILPPPPPNVQINLPISVGTAGSQQILLPAVEPQAPVVIDPKPRLPVPTPTPIQPAPLPHEPPSTSSQTPSPATQAPRSQADPVKQELSDDLHSEVLEYYEQEQSKQHSKQPVAAAGYDSDSTESATSLPTRSAVNGLMSTDTVLSYLRRLFFSNATHDTYFPIVIAPRLAPSTFIPGSNLPAGTQHNDKQPSDGISASFEPEQPHSYNRQEVAAGSSTTQTPQHHLNEYDVSSSVTSSERPPIRRKPPAYVPQWGTIGFASPRPTEHAQPQQPDQSYLQPAVPDLPTLPSLDDSSDIANEGSKHQDPYSSWSFFPPVVPPQHPGRRQPTNLAEVTAPPHTSPTPSQPVTTSSPSVPPRPPTVTSQSTEHSASDVKLDAASSQPQLVVQKGSTVVYKPSIHFHNVGSLQLTGLLDGLVTPVLDKSDGPPSYKMLFKTPSSSQANCSQTTTQKTTQPTVATPVTFNAPKKPFGDRDDERSLHSVIGSLIGIEDDDDDEQPDGPAYGRSTQYHSSRRRTRRNTDTITVGVLPPGFLPWAATLEDALRLLWDDSAMEEILEYVMERDNDNCFKRLTCERASQDFSPRDVSRDEDMQLYISALFPTLTKSQNKPSEALAAYRGAALAGIYSPAQPHCALLYPECKRSLAEIEDVARKRLRLASTSV